MYIIKHLPEDFIVVEKSTFPLSERGDYAIYEMTKREHTTHGALTELSRAMHLPLSHFSVAGNKDKKAITTQLISIFKAPSAQEWTLPDITLTFKGFSRKKIALGDLEGNAFTITIRNLDQKDILSLQDFERKNSENPILVPNYFGPQRFSSSNHLIGSALVKKNFKGALDIILASDHEHASHLSRFLSEHPGNAIGALRLIPASMVKMYLHAYQSSLFNKTLQTYLGSGQDSLGKETKNNSFNIPILGFGTEIGELEETLRGIIKTILAEEKLSLRDFINRQMPEISSEGGEREAFFSAPDFTIVEQGEDEHFPRMGKTKLSFTLKKSCYATVFLAYVLDGLSDILNDRL